MQCISMWGHAFGEKNNVTGLLAPVLRKVSLCVSSMLYYLMHPRIAETYAIHGHCIAASPLCQKKQLLQLSLQMNR